MAKVVVTGGAGFIGSHIVAEAIAQGHQVTVLDDLSTGFKKNLAQLDCEFVEGSILDQTKLDQVLPGVETVFHLGAKISVPESMEKKAEYVNTNVLGTLQLLDSCVQHQVKNITLSSSAAIYGNNPTIPKTEDMLPEPMSPYAVTKLDGEYYFDLYRREHGLNATSLRYFNVFGPRQDPNSQYAAAVPIFIDKALNNQDITIYGDGEQTRDFIFVKDIVQANFLAAKIGGNIFNVAWGQRITINDLAKTIIELTDSSSKIIYLPERAGDIKHSMADNAKIVRELGFKPSSTLRDGLLATIEGRA